MVLFRELACPRIQSFAWPASNLLESRRISKYLARTLRCCARWYGLVGMSLRVLHTYLIRVTINIISLLPVDQARYIGSGWRFLSQDPPT